MAGNKNSSQYFWTVTKWYQDSGNMSIYKVAPCEERMHSILVKMLCYQYCDGSVYVYVTVLTPKEGDAMPAAQKLVRKQFLISPTQAKKIESIAKRQKISAAEIVRKAIDAFNPDATPDMADTDLLDLVRVRVKEAIKDTKKTRERLSAALNKLKPKEG